MDVFIIIVSSYYTNVHACRLCAYSASFRATCYAHVSIHILCLIMCYINPTMYTVLH